MHNPNYKGKNYDPNFQVKCTEAAHPSGKQQQNSFAAPNQYKQAYNKPTSTYGSNNNTPLSSSSDIVGEVTLKTSVDGYQLLKVNKMIKNAVAWRVRMPKASKISTYFNGNSKDQPRRHKSLRYTSMRPCSKSWAKLPRTSATQSRNL